MSAFSFNNFFAGLPSYILLARELGLHLAAPSKGPYGVLEQLARKENYELPG